MCPQGGKKQTESELESHLHQHLLWFRKVHPLLCHAEKGLGWPGAVPGAVVSAHDQLFERYLAPLGGARFTQPCLLLGLMLLSWKVCAAISRVLKVRWMCSPFLANTGSVFALPSLQTLAQFLLIQRFSEIKMIFFLVTALSLSHF